MINNLDDEIHTERAEYMTSAPRDVTDESSVITKRLRMEEVTTAASEGVKGRSSPSCGFKKLSSMIFTEAMPGTF